MSYKGGADKDLFSHISAPFSLNAFFGVNRLYDGRLSCKVNFKCIADYIQVLMA
jgi:hypothetical protein